MSAKNQQKTLRAALLVSALLIVAILIWAIAFKKPLAITQNQPALAQSEKSAGDQSSETSNQQPETSDQQPETSDQQPETNGEPTLTLQQITAQASGWGPGFNQWFGKNAPDFTLTDINGKKHNITDYKGKNLIINFWTTWCPPCRTEIPHLIEIRNSIGEDKLAMLAISNENEQKVKSFAQANNMNYTVAATSDSIPAPFNSVKYIPTSFFIDQNGKFKFAAVGSLDLESIRNILKAEK